MSESANERTVVPIPPGDGTTAGFLRSFADSNGLPDLHGRNWDAFEDAFSAFLAESDRPVTLEHREPPRLSARDQQLYAETLADLAREFPGRLSVRWPDGLNATPCPAWRDAAIVHHHLNRGGVTRVVANHLLSLAASTGGTGDRPSPSAVLLTGGRREAWEPHEAELHEANVNVAQRVVRGLDYDDQPQDETTDADTLAERMDAALRNACADPGRTVVHVHNPSLGKAVALPGALATLARRGWRLLLQLHDFAEEFRPANYLRLREALGENAILYPQAPQIHYAVLNGRDREVLRRLGVPEERLHFLPNPVADFPPLPGKADARAALAAACGVPADDKYLCYPVRGIRRKNLGEAILTGLLEPDATVGVTLAPRNPVELAFHDRWRAFAEELDLPVRFGTGEEDGVSFHENLAAADAILTTSVAEGFGMAFLECWLADRPLMGRDLPHVTADFKAEGLKLPGLYQSLTVPLDWADGFAERFRAGCEKLLNDYRRPWYEAAFAEALAAKTPDDRVDFADLDEDLQTAVIRRIADDPAARGDVYSVEADPGRPTDGVVNANAATVRDRYDLAGSGARLRATYDAVLAAPIGEVTGPPHPGAVLDSFLNLQTFRLIRG